MREDTPVLDPREDRGQAPQPMEEVGETPQYMDQLPERPNMQDPGPEEEATPYFNYDYDPAPAPAAEPEDDQDAALDPAELPHLDAKLVLSLNFLERRRFVSVLANLVT